MEDLDEGHPQRNHSRICRFNGETINQLVIAMAMAIMSDNQKMPTLSRCVNISTLNGRPRVSLRP